MNDVILKIDNISKAFPGVQALLDISFEIKRGSIHALLGENGAEKSTLIKIISGILRADSGTVEMNGEHIEINNPRDAQEFGISVVHQELKLVEPLTVAENIFLGKLFIKGIFTDWKKVRREAQNLIDGLGISINISSLVSELSISQQQVVEICKAMTYDAKIFILDEPTATLTETEIKKLFGIMRKIQENGGTIIYISHRLEEVFEVCNELTVLRDGRYIGTKKVSEATKTELIKMMVGRELKEEYPKVDAAIGDKVLEIDNITRGRVLDGASLYLRRGEILGLSGLIGSGRTELMRAILGIDKHTDGSVTLRGKKVKFKRFSDAIREGFGFITEDRKRQGLILGMPVKNNITLAAMKKVSKASFISFKRESEVANEYINKLRIATPSDKQEVKYLSGGNQQKVVLAKWLFVNSDIVIIDEPTRGIDVGAKVEIFKLLNNLVMEGKSVLMISSDMPELIGMCDRIYVMHEGKIRGVLNREEFSSEKILNIAYS